MRLASIAALLLLATAACGKGQDDTHPNATPAAAATATAVQTATAAPTAEPTPPKPAKHVDLEIASVANTMAFDKTKLSEPAGYFDVRDKDALAHTPMAKPGQSTELTFTAPTEPGDYPYICTVPGHYMMMKGVLTVTP